MNQKCRCGLTYPVGDTLAMIAHVTSAEHDERVKHLPPTHNHSDKDWNNAPRFRDDCPACQAIVLAGKPR